jgi:hypothetical protein
MISGAAKCPALESTDLALTNPIMAMHLIGHHKHPWRNGQAETLGLELGRPTTDRSAFALVPIVAHGAHAG